jgi:hypothetical protein
LGFGLNINFKKIFEAIKELRSPKNLLNFCFLEKITASQAKLTFVETSVSNPYSFNPVPYPLWIHGFDVQKFTAEKKIKYFFDQKLQFTYP